VDFINKKSYKIKKTINVIIPVLLGAVILLGNIVSIPGYNLSIPKSFAQGNNHDVFSHNAGSLQNQFAAPIVHTALHSIGNIDPSALAVPFSGIRSFSNIIPSFTDSNHDNSLCSAIKGTDIASTLSSSLCKNSTNPIWDPTFTYTKSLTNTKGVTFDHTHTRYRVVGPDNFKFINSYWTTSETTRAVDVGTSANTTYLSSASHISNVPLETDNAYGPTTLAVELQYEGAMQLIGITAALKLPPGFVSNLPLIHDPHRYDISFSNYRGHIYPGQGITLYFPITIIGNVGVRVPYLAPLAIHFLKEDKRFDTASLSASEQDQFAASLVIKNGTSTSTYTDNSNLNRNFNAVNEQLYPYDFVNQVLPAMFAITGQEIFSVIVGSGPGTALPISPILALLPPGVPTPIKILVRNTGDAPIYNLNAAAAARDESAISATVVPSSVNIPNFVQQNAVEPIVLIGGQSRQIGFLPVNGTAELDITAVPSFYAGGTVEPILVTLNFNNAVGLPTTLVKRIGLEILPVTAQTALQDAAKIPHAISDNVISLPNAISNKALHALSNDIARGSSPGLH
jgi:hypothetical protein